MFSPSQIKYNAPLPGEEFRTRQLSVPGEAAKILYEIDSQHGESKELCTTILQNVFRDDEGVRKAALECAKNFQGGDTWKFHAAIARNIRIAKLDAQLTPLSR